MHQRSTTLCLAVAAALCACNSKDAAKPDTIKTAAQAGAPATGTNLGSYDPATHVATIHARDYAFQVPDSIPAGWTTFHLVNDGPS
ncbi:MAG TPA: hypothetical protein VHV78_13150, partial [Gemmatimonadaceae bacterium]|nr:hypothetical protein [Gemmatimonadaceae bacterium]